MKSTQIRREYKQYEELNDIVFLINYDYEEKRVIKGYKVSTCFGQSTIDLFDNRLEKMIDKLDIKFPEDEGNNFQTMTILFMESEVYTIEQLQERFKFYYQY